MPTKTKETDIPLALLDQPEVYSIRVEDTFNGVFERFKPERIRNGEASQRVVLTDRTAALAPGSHDQRSAPYMEVHRYKEHPQWWKVVRAQEGGPTTPALRSETVYFMTLAGVGSQDQADPDRKIHRLNLVEMAALTDELSNPNLELRKDLLRRHGTTRLRRFGRALRRKS